MSDYEIRVLQKLSEFEALTRLENEVWGDEFQDRVGVSTLKAAAMVGGVISGAFDRNGEMVGFVFGLTGLENGVPFHWSHMLGVRSGLRDAGLGTALKLHQRERMLAVGVERIAWSYDPLQSRNAYVNLGKLGAVAQRYVREMYGETTSPLHRGIGTDRLIAEWRITSPRVLARLAGKEPPPSLEQVLDLPRVNATDIESGRLRCADPDLSLSAPRILLTIPADIGRLQVDSMQEAVAWRAKTRQAFEHYLDRGYEVQELVREDADLTHYLLVSQGS